MSDDNNDIKTIILLLLEVQTQSLVSGPGILSITLETLSNVIYEENESGYLLKSKSSNATRRQDCPDVYKANGSIYIIDADLIMKKNLAEFEYIKKVVMPDYRSVDIDNSLDWAIAENLLISNNKIW